MGRHRRVEQSFRILFVCTANMCRSPTAEILMRAALQDRMGGAAARAFDVASAGVTVPQGRRSLHPLTRAELDSRGLTAAARQFVVTQLRPERLGRVDLVLGAERHHCAAVVEQAPEMLPVTFRLCEFARLVAAVDVSDLPRTPVMRAYELVELVRTNRGLAAAGDPRAEDITDPVGGFPADHRRVTDAIASAVLPIAAAISGRP